MQCSYSVNVTIDIDMWDILTDAATDLDTTPADIIQQLISDFTDPSGEIRRAAGFRSTVIFTDQESSRLQIDRDIHRSGEQPASDRP